MPKRINRIGIGGATVEPVFWTGSQIHSIQKTLGKRLPKKAWADIALATALYQLICSGEKTATPATEFISSLSRLDKSLQSVRERISKAPTKKIHIPKRHLSDRVKDRSKGVKILNEIEERFFKVEKSNPSHQIDVMFHLLAHAIDALSAVSAWVQYEMSHPEYQGYKEGSAWEWWIVWLTMIMKEHGLPYKASKATINPNARISPFVAFLSELQTALPTGLQRYQQSKDSLAQGISRARRAKFLEAKFEDVVKVKSFWPEYPKLFLRG
jgi:hypothetical protein